MGAERSISPGESFPDAPLPALTIELSRRATDRTVNWRSQDEESQYFTHCGPLSQGESGGVVLMWSCGRGGWWQFLAQEHTQGELHVCSQLLSNEGL